MFKVSKVKGLSTKTLNNSVMNCKKVIFDTDVGMDDAMALFMLLRAHRERLIQLVGITAVQGNTGVDNVVTNVFRILDLVSMSEKIPVYKGAHVSLVEPYVNIDPLTVDPWHGIDGFGDLIHDKEADLSLLKKEHAVQALLRIVKENPGEITIIAVGPLTNIALAMRMDPNFAINIKEMYIMGGNLEGIGNMTPSAEFNFHCDAEAASIVFRNLCCTAYLVAWELCYKRSFITWDWRMNDFGKLGTPEVELLNRIEQKHLASEIHFYPNWIACDPIAAAIAIDPSVIAESSTHYASVELSGKLTRGQMVIDYQSLLKQKPNIILVDRIEVERFKQLLLWGLGSQAADFNSK